jgi:hypothetical protein
VPGKPKRYTPEFKEQAVKKADCIRWMVALRESAGGAGLGGLGLLPRCGLGLGWALAE